MLWLSNNVPLCECPEWGMNGTRCTHIGFRMKEGGYAGPWLCLKYGEVELQSTLDGWLVRCEACANGGYEARSPEVMIGKTPAKKQAQPKPRKPRSLTHADLRDLPPGISDRELLVEMLRRARGPVTKADLLKLASSRHWPGYTDASFVSAQLGLKRVFDTLVFDGVVIHEKGKPLRLREE